MTTSISLPLSKSLKEQTARAHTDAERSSFMTVLLDGGLSVEAFADYTAQLYVVYRQLECSVRVAADHPVLGRFYDPRLERVPALEDDLAQLYGPDWRSVIRVLPESLAYVARLAALPANGVGELAHHYVRYLGDISGGQAIARLAAAHYGLGPEHLGFYDFTRLGKIKPYRDSYRAGLDALDLSPRQRAGLIAEATTAFKLNFSLLAALSARHGIGE